MKHQDLLNRMTLAEQAAFLSGKVKGMVTAVNGHLFRGMKQMLKGYFANARANKQYEAKLSRKEMR